MTIQEARTIFSKQIEESFKNSPQKKEQARTATLDADLIICNAIQKERSWILFHRDEKIDETALKKIESDAEKRKTGLPVAYITGKKEFFGNEFFVTTDVLIPKPDTEILVEKTIETILDGESFCDLCTGSGCVGISVLKSILESGKKIKSAVFVDKSTAALKIAKKNAQKIIGQFQKIEFIESDLFSAVPQKFDVIATNPPYVPTKIAKLLLEDGRNEPLLALDGLSDDGLFVIKNLVFQSTAHLKKNGRLLMETGEYNANAAADLLNAAGFSDVKIERDLAGNLRVVCGVFVG